MKKHWLLYCLMAFVMKAYPQTDLNKGLMAYYPFNGNAEDASGNNNHPVFNNATLTSNRFGEPNSAYHFNGINTYMRIPNSVSLNAGNTITLSAWVRPTGFYYDICHASIILLKGTADYLPGNYALRFDDALFTGGQGCSGDRLKDSLHLNFRGTGTPMKTYEPYIKKNGWYSVIYTNDGTTARLYVNCELKYAVPFKEKFTNTDDLLLGRTNDAMFPFWLNGDLDDIRIYNRALSLAEITTLCKEQKKKDTIKPIAPVKEAIKKDSIKPAVIPVIAPAKEIPLEKRSNDLVRQIEVEHDSITVTLYDNGEVDGDSVTLIYNSKTITTHLRLTEKPVTFTLKVDRTASNELVMYAENLGSIPPNTALMVIYDDKKRYELNISSTKSSNGVVAFRLKQ
ncbi:LamG domain-containing protein [Ferruginibacter sp.]